MSISRSLPLIFASLFFIAACQEDAKRSNENGENGNIAASECPVKAGEGSKGFRIDITKHELREKRPHQDPEEHKKALIEHLNELRKGKGLECGTEKRTQSYFTAADALYADGRLESANLVLFNLERKLEALQAARGGEPKENSLIRSEEDILAYRDAHNIHVIDPSYITGAQPSEKGYEWLKEKGITDVINLRGTAEHERAMIEELGMNYHHVGWPDMKAPDTSKVNRVKRIIDNAEGKVFQHCLRGIGRDMTMSSIIQVARGKDVDSVIEHGKHLAPTWAADQERTQDGTPVQFHFIRKFAEEHAGS